MAEEPKDTKDTIRVRRVWGVDYSFDPDTGWGTKTTIEDDKVVSVEVAHIGDF